LLHGVPRGCRAIGGGPLGGVGPRGCRAGGGGPLGGVGPRGCRAGGGGPMGGAPMGGAPLGGASMGGAAFEDALSFEDAPMLRVMRRIAIAAVPDAPLGSSERAVSAWNSKVRRTSTLKASVRAPTTSSIASWSQRWAL